MKKQYEVDITDSLIIEGITIEHPLAMQTSVQQDTGISLLSSVNYRTIRQVQRYLSRKVMGAESVAINITPSQSKRRTSSLIAVWVSASSTLPALPEDQDPFKTVGSWLRHCCFRTL